MAAEKDLNEFGAVLLELLEARGMTVAELAAIISARPEAPEITEEEILATMTAEPGEEFMRLVAAFDEALQSEN